MTSLIVDRSTLSEMGPPLDVEVEAVEALCRHTIAVEYADLAAGIPGLPQDPQSWMQLLNGVPDDRCSMRVLGGYCELAERQGTCSPGSIERFGALQAALAALPQLESLGGHDSLNRQFCATFRRVASRAQGWGRHFRYDSDAFAELARIVSLRRYHAGQISFDVMATPRAWFLRVHPLALPSLAREVAVEMGGLGPIMMPHLNYWRANSMTLSEKESYISHHRIVQYMEQQPEIRGLVSASWLYSSEMKNFSPHIAWLREFYIDGGAYLLDMEVAPQRAGFLAGSESRRRLHAEGKLRPRETLVVWSRERMLKWARENARDYTATHGARQPRLGANDRREPKWKSNANQIFSSGQYTLFNLGPLLRDKPRHYIVLVFLLPLLILAVSAVLTAGVISALPILAVSFVVIWLFQYFFLQ